MPEFLVLREKIEFFQGTGGENAALKCYIIGVYCVFLVNPNHGWRNKNELSVSVLA